MIRSTIAAVALLLPVLATAQTTEFGNLNVVQNDAGNNATSVTVTTTAGTTPNFAIRSGSNKGDFNITLGYPNDYTTGVLIASVSQNGRNNNAFGDTIGQFYATVAPEIDVVATPVRYYITANNASAAAEEVNVNIAAAHFPYSQWLGGLGRHSAATNGGATDTFVGSTGITLGTQFTTAGAGVFGLNLTTINASYTSQNGILLVNHVKNEDNYALSRANANGSFSMWVRDSYTNGTNNEQDPIGFVYLGSADVGTKRLKCMGRVNSDASTDVTGGTFTVTKGLTGQWYLTIPGMTNSTGVLIISPEGGGTNNIDNHVSYQWDAANSRWIIESRDSPASGLPVLEDGATAAEDMFSFAFFEAPIIPSVAITAPTTGTSLVKPVAYSVDATATDANGTITQVEFFRNGTLVATDTTAPYSLSEAGLNAGIYNYTARATDNDGFATTSSSVTITVTLDPLNLPTNTSLAFDGVDDYVAMGAAPELNAGGPPSNGLTLECWFRKEGTGITATSGSGGVVAVPLFGKGRGEGDGANIDCNYFFGVTTAGILVADFETYPATGLVSGQNYPITATNTPIVNNQWYHAAVTYDGATATWKMYLDGVQVGTATAAAGALPRYDSIQHFGIGAALNSTGVREGAFAGRMDEVRVWNYARSASDILAAKDLEIASAAGLIGRFGLNEGTGNTTANSPGAAGVPVGTLTSGPTWVEGASFVSNAAPTVTLTAPTPAYTGMAPATVSFAADATDSDGTVTKVEFFQGTTKVGEDTTAPYAFDWTSVAAGTYSLTAKATDNSGAATSSIAVSITVDPNSNQPPVIAATSPAADATGIGASTTLNVSLSDPENDAMTVTFYGRKTTPATPGADFTIATLPDTQFYSENLSNNGRSATFHAQTQWLVDNRDALNLAFVSHMGDIVQNGDAVPAEWVVAGESLKRIENPATTLRAHGIPWGAAPGNHDQTSIGNAGGANVYFNQTFGTSRFAGRRYWGASQSLTNNNNNYQLFSASGLDFVIIHLEYDARAKTNYQTILDWADAVMKAFPNRRAIVTSHWIVNTGNPASFSTQGQNFYNDLKDNPNFFLMLCGHVAGEGQRSDTFQGRTVYSILQDYQGRTNGGDGWLRYFTFSPANNTINAKTYRVSNPINSAAGTFETDADSQFTLPYNMQSAVTDWVPLGTANVAAAGTSASLNWTGLEAGSHYEWYASVTDTINVANTNARRFSTSVNASPTVAITAPANNAAYTSPAAFTITADAADTDGSITKIEFYQGGVKLGEDSAAPYEQSVSGLLVGSYAFSAIAVDNGGATTLSSIVNVTVNASLPPVVSLTAPLSTDSFDAPATVNLAADAVDTDGISLVEFFNGTTKLGEDSTAPYTFAWTGVISGTYSLTAKATDNAATAATSTAVVITVVNADNVAPTVSVTSPAAGDVFAGSITINASASDTDGIVSKVEFFQGATKLGEDTTAPYSYVWSGVTVGNYTLTAKATDNDAGLTTSGSVAINVIAAPVAFSENFDSMGTAGTALPAGWSIKNGEATTSTNSTWTDSIPIIANGATGSVASMVAAAGALTVNNAPTANQNNGYNAQGSSSTDRVIATAPTSVSGMAIQWQLSNTGASIITALRIGYDIRRYTAPASANELPGYQLFYSLDNGTTWTGVPALNPTLSGVGVQVPNSIGVTTVAPTDFTLSSGWAPAATLLLRWIDDNAVATSPDQVVGLDNVTLLPAAIQVGIAPTISITSPTNGTIFNVGDTISIVANAADTDGSVTKVEFYQGATKLGEDTTSPYAFDWSGFTAGNYSLTARATDNDSNLVTSSAISLTVNVGPGSGTLTRGPYLNLNNQNSIVIRWRSSQSVVGRVRYGDSPTNLTNTVNEAAAATDHVVQLTGLTPYTRYYYSIGSAFDTLAGGDAEHSFRTSPNSATDTRIWVVGDCGRGSQFQRDVRDAYYAWTGARAPDMCLMLGDNAYNSGTDSEYQTGFYNIYSTMFRKMPLWSTLGNHDANNGSTSSTANFPYFDMFTFPTAGECGGVASGTERYFSWDYGNVHVVNLDSQTSSRNTMEVNGSDGPMAAWLRNDLASTTKTWIIVIFHHPPYSKGSHDSDTEGQMVQMRTNFGPILENGGADVVLVGHSHAYERSMLIDSHYGVSSTLTNAMKKNAGSGRPSGTGAYIKPLTGPRDHFGTVYTVTGSAGSADGGSLNHAAMYVSYNTGGTLNLDINGNTLSATYIEKGATTGTFTTPDTFTIIKQGAADSDGDSVADEFEIANGMNRFSNADAATDNDGDGLDAVAEYLFGLNPGGSDRYPWTTSPINPTTGHVDIAFPTLPQRGYRVFYSENLLNWFPASGIIPGDGTTKVWTDDGAVTGAAPGTSPKRFYKVEVLPAP
jgi:hypothetical protein